MICDVSVREISLTIAIATAITSCGRVGFEARGATGATDGGAADVAVARDATTDAFGPVQTITMVQSVGSSGFSNIATLPFDSAVTAGNTIVVAVDITDGATITELIDSLGNATFPAVALSEDGGDQLLALFYAPLVTGGADSVTVMFSGMTTLELRIHEFAGISPTNPLDGATFLAGTATAPTTLVGPSVTTSEPDEMIFGFELSSTATAGSGFTTALEFDEDTTEYEIAPTPGVYASTDNLISGSNVPWGITAAFRAPAPM